jgi:hypothetical protein
MRDTVRSAENTAATPAASPEGEVERQRQRLLALRAELVSARETAISPAIARALEMAETYLFLGLGYVGHTDELFPGEGTIDADGR